MKRIKTNKKTKVKTLFLILGIISLSLFAYYIYGLYKISLLEKMSSDEMIAYTTKNNKNAVITVGIIQNGEVTYTVYGENGSILNPKEYVYEIGSITKTFTTSLLCKAISEKKISLDDPINNYLNLPPKEYYPTISRLVTHTSGYKNYYFEVPMITNYLNRVNDFYSINENQLINRIGKINLNNQDYTFNYSNFGFAILGSVLEQVYDEDYSALMNSYIKNDLKLVNTKLSEGLGDLGNYWEWADSDAYLPAGGIVSTISDMIKYAQIQMLETPRYLSIAHNSLAAIDNVNNINEKMGINLNEVGVGWIIDTKNNIVWHNGGTGNYNSYIGFDKEKQIAVVVLSNLPPNHKIPATVIGIEILTTLQNK